MQCYTELIPPTAVSHSISIPFLGSFTNNLVVAKTSLLQIFNVKTKALNRGLINDGVNAEGSNQHSLGDEDAFQKQENQGKLVLVGEYALSGTVTSLARVKVPNTKAGGDVLLVSFKDAKISLIEWDPENYRISTISIHYYEGDKIQLAPFGPDLSDCDSQLTVDPRSRCAALKFGVKHLAILPFRQPEDDLAEGDYDPNLDSPPPTKVKEEQAAPTSAATTKDTPYASSFVLPLTAIDPALSHPVSLGFLYEYREPTFGIVSSNKAASAAILEERKDVLTYSVFTLDLEQRASTQLLTVTGLPFDIFKMVPLPLPIGGSLLVGSNELIHIDQAGKTNAVGVNEFAKQCSDFSMADQSSLGIRLEGCAIANLNPTNGDMLIVMGNGHLAILSFRIDGRNVSGLAVHPVDNTMGTHVVASGPSSTASLSGNRLFIGSEDGDSVLLGWSEKLAHLSRKRSHAQMMAEDDGIALDEEDSEAEDAEDDDDADDDLYGGESSAVKVAATAAASKASAPGSYTFRIHDTLASLGPINSVCFGKSANKRRKIDSSPENLSPALSLLATMGRGRSSCLASLNRELFPSIIRSTKSPGTHAIWSICAKHAAASGLPQAEDGQLDPEEQLASDLQYDQYMIKFEVNEDSDEISKVYKIVAVDDGTNEDLSEIEGTDFESEGETLNMGTLAFGTRIIQVRKSEIRSYDADFGLSQIFPVLDSSTEEELQVLHSAFCDPYLLVIRSDSTAQVLRVDESGDLDEVDSGDGLLSARWMSGCLYKSTDTADTALAFLLSAEGGLTIFELPNLAKAVYTAPMLAALPPVLSTEDRQRRAAARETLTELMVADLGDESHKEPYLIVRSSIDDLTLYKPFHYPPAPRHARLAFTENLRFRKIPSAYVPKYDEETSTARAEPLSALSDVGGRTAVFMGGGSPSLIVKEGSSLPRVLDLGGKPVKALTSYNTQKCKAGFAYLDYDGTLRNCQLPKDTLMGSTAWAARKFFPLPSEHIIHSINYHSDSDLYIIASSETVDFFPPEDETKQQGTEDDSELRPTTSQYYLHLFEPHTGAIINTLSLPPHEMVTSVTCAPLEVSEVLHNRKLLVAAGTVSQRGEAYAARGGVYVLDIIEVVPELGKPETGKRLHILGREDTKGGITALMGIGGLLGTGQGQKIIFRGLKEDGQCLPVAFLDAQCYITSLKTMGSSNLWLAADAWKGLWFGGFSEEPYKISLFGKSRSKMEVIVAEFLPFEDQLFLIVIDAEMDMHVLQYDPENPKSLSGQSLLHRSTFHIGHFPTSMTLVPSTLSPFTEQLATNGTSNGDSEMHENGDVAPSSAKAASLHHILITSQSGSVALLTPLDEGTYRRLYALQTTLTSVLEHPAGLNPRAYRSVESEGLGARGIVDGDLICRIGELGAGRRAEVLGRAGGEVWGLRSDLEIIGGRGLGYL